MKLLLFSGAGVSAELGVPAMRSMAEQFVEHLRDAEVPHSMVSTMEKLLESGNHDMEHAIDLVDKIVGGEQAKHQLGIPADSALSAYALIREEAEWFVQHACEQIDARRAYHMWSPALRAAKSHQVVIASTNYDRAIEIAATRLKLTFADGFEPFSGREYAPWTGFPDSDALHILKLHGSTDWYHGKDGEVFKLRHPMPLFGALEVNSAAGVAHLRSALVLPSREKKTTQPPFPALQARFRHELIDAEAAFFVGSSLRDPHLRDICAECAKRFPTYVVTRDGIAPQNLPAGAREIIQTGGQFLISTLPAYLKNNVESLLDDSQLVLPGRFSPLDHVIMAANTSADVVQRSSAIESLAEHQASLGQEFIIGLLQSDNSEVKLNALGLVQSSYDHAEVLDYASSVAAVGNDAAFCQELELLLKLSPPSARSELKQKIA
ncbi:hypothetical protein V1278_001873 [Bradyrhizobium sp. AZCC 1577]|uniref:SIR2 family protein n=1 Tax=Bradyrhizobium sp. AZCC 1577 TaxID=3117019 RepID=UPI002FEE8FCC